MLLRATLSALAATAALSAQNDFDWDKVTSGRLGGPITMQATGAPPNQVVLFVPSNNAGPTPLILVDGVDTRSMQIGIDLLGAMGVGVTSPSGDVSYSVPIPNDLIWNNMVLHWQCAMIPFAGPTLVGEISNDIVTQFGAQDTGVPAPTNLATARALATSFVDANNNAAMGDVLITGGGAGTLTAATGLASTEIYDYRRMQMVPGPTMNSSRALHLAVTLTDNRVLLIGGANSAGVILNTCEIYDPVTNTFTPTASMSTPRTLHAACRLADGRVMVAGGASALDPANLVITALSSVEIWNPATGLWTAANPISGTRLGVSLTLLSNSQVMVAGGVNVTYFLGFPSSANTVTTVQRWNPGTGLWTAGPNMAQDRAGHHFNQVTLADGRVLMSGGVDVPSLAGINSSAPINGAELYNPTTNTWQTVNMAAARALHSATRLADGRVVVCGGAQGTLLAPVSISGVEVFNPGTNTWAPAPALLGPRGAHNAALSPDGTLVLFGGQGAAASLATIETLRF